MFTQKNTKPFSKWLKLLFTLTLCIAFFASCNDDDDELTPEEIEEERIETATQGLVGTWEFAASEIITGAAPADTADYRGIKSTLGAVGSVNGSEITLNGDGTYKFTNFVIGGGSYEITGDWEYRNDPTFQEDFIQLKGLYNQLLNQINADRVFFTEVFADSFDNFQVGTRTDDEIQLSNEGIIIEDTGVDVPPNNISVEGNYTIVRK